jgi:hypothetical protein
VAIADTPIIRGAGGAARCLARHGVVHVESPDSNVTLHLTKLQWQHSQMTLGAVRGEELPLPGGPVPASIPLFHFVRFYSFFITEHYQIAHGSGNSPQ